VRELVRVGYVAVGRDTSVRDAERVAVRVPAVRALLTVAVATVRCVSVAVGTRVIVGDRVDAPIVRDTVRVLVRVNSAVVERVADITVRDRVNVAEADRLEVADREWALRDSESCTEPDAVGATEREAVKDADIGAVGDGEISALRDSDLVRTDADASGVGDFDAVSSSVPECVRRTVFVSVNSCVAVATGTVITRFAVCPMASCTHCAYSA
jgi:hypothetical protein